MMRFFTHLIFFILISFNTVKAQVNTKKGWTDANPVPSQSDLSLSAQIKIHEAYLKKAVSDNDITRQFYARLYLFTDYINDQDYTQAADHLLQAENIAKEENNKAWLGFIKLKSGWICWTVKIDMRAAIKEFEKGIQFSTEAQDSLCLAECMAQMSSMYGNLKEFEKGHYYFNLALPILKKFSNSDLGGVYNNYNNLLAYENRPLEGKVYLDSAIAIAQKQNDIRRATIYMTNLGIYYEEIKQYDKALEIFKNCEAVNEKNKWFDNLMYDYDGLSNNYYAVGDYRKAYDYRKKYEQLKDSLYGISTNIKIAELTAKNASQRKQMELDLTKRRLERSLWIMFIGVILIALVIWLWVSQSKREKRKRLLNEKNLTDLTALLLQKNTLLIELEEKLSVKQTDPGFSPGAADFEKSLYNQRILTDSDWASFKTYFERVHPGYILRVRNAFANITESEERLFLFLKLALTSRETAAMLGISADSVKKTRNRLRRRLGIDENIDLYEYVKGF